MKTTDMISNVEAIRDFLIAKKLTLAVAESVTCGMLQSCFSSIEFTSQFFQGGITTYNLGQKVRHLKIEPIEGELNNCVSQKVAEQMAIGAVELFLSDITISITGYASPLPEKGITDLFAYFSIALHSKILATGRLTSDKTTPHAVQKDYCEQVLERAILILRKSNL